MTSAEKIEIARKWGTSLVVLLIVPMVQLTLTNERLKVERFIQENYVSNVRYEKERGEHKEWGEKEVSRLQHDNALVDVKYEKLATKIDSLGIKLDAALLNIAALNTRFETRKPEGNQ